MDHAHLTPGGGTLLKERATPPQGARMCTNCWGVGVGGGPRHPKCQNDVYTLLGVRGPTPKDVHTLLGVQEDPTPKNVYTLLGHSGGNLGVLGGLDGVP